jgi:hypothetical protein
MIRFFCPHCRAKLHGPNERAGSSTKCPKCKQPVTVPAVSERDSSTPVVCFRCPLCGAVHEKPARFAGEIIPCPSCKERIEIPRPAPAESPPDMAAVIAEVIQKPKPAPVPKPQPAPLPLIPAKQNEDHWIPPLVTQPPPPPKPAPRPAAEDLSNPLWWFNLIKDKAPGPAPAPHRPARTGWVELRVSARLLRWPASCACCLGPEETQVDAVCLAAHRRKAKAWRVPYCQRCADDVLARRAGPSVLYLDWEHSVHFFRFWNQDYALAFAMANESKMLR